MKVLSKLMGLWSKLMELRNDRYSYVYSLVKLTICSIIFIIFLFIKIPAKPNTWRNGISMLMLILMYISISFTLLRLDEIHENRNQNKIKVKEKWVVQSGIKKIGTILTENDLIDLKVKTKNKIMSIGASNCLDPDSGEFVSKKYYINKREYDTIDEFIEELRKIYPGGKVTICSIDGISPKKTKYFNED